MSTDEVKAICDRALETMRRRLAINRWEITVVFEPLEAGTLGSCCVLERYERARISIDPTQHEEEPEVLRTLRHELLHVVLGESDLLRTTLKLKGDANRVFHHVGERNVLAFERALDALGWTPEELGGPLIKEPTVRVAGRQVRLDLPGRVRGHPAATLTTRAASPAAARSVADRLGQALRWHRRADAPTDHEPPPSRRSRP